MTPEATALPPHGGISSPSGHGGGGPAPKRIVVAYGFWIFLLSDIIMFAALFATYAVLVSATDGGPTPKDLFDLGNVRVETVSLLLSSFTCGMAIIAANRRNHLWTQVWLLLTGLLGLLFLVLELREFAGMIARSAPPQRSAFLSSFFALVGCHGTHITAGLLWIGTMMAQIWAKSFTPAVQRRLMCFALFWHALDIVWVAIFSIVYLMGTAP